MVTMEELEKRIKRIELKMKLDGSWYVDIKDKFKDRKYTELKAELKTIEGEI